MKIFIGFGLLTAALVLIGILIWDSNALQASLPIDKISLALIMGIIGAILVITGRPVVRVRERSKTLVNLDVRDPNRW